MTEFNELGSQWNSYFSDIAVFRNQVAIEFNERLENEHSVKDEFANGHINL